MSYHPVKKKTSVLNIFLILAVVALVIVVLLFTPLFSFLSRKAHGPSVGLWKAGDTISESVFDTVSITTHSKQHIFNENKALREEIDLYKGKLLALSQLEVENEELRNMLNVVDRESLFVTARVLSRPEQSLYNLLIIEGGREDGIAVGDMVTAFGTVLLGEVIEVFPQTAKIRLYSSPGISRDAILLSDNLVLPITGHGAGNFRLELPRDIEVENGTLLLDNATRKILGTIQASIFDPREPFQTVLVRSSVNIHHLTWVQVMKMY